MWCASPLLLQQRCSTMELMSAIACAPPPLVASPCQTHPPDSLPPSRSHCTPIPPLQQRHVAARVLLPRHPPCCASFGCRAAPPPPPPSSPTCYSPTGSTSVHCSTKGMQKTSADAMEKILEEEESVDIDAEAARRLTLSGGRLLLKFFVAVGVRELSARQVPEVRRAPDVPPCITVPTGLGNVSSRPFLSQRSRALPTSSSHNNARMRIVIVHLVLDDKRPQHW